MNETMQIRFSLRTLGRARVDAIDWVVYDDGCYRHVVAAEDYDAPHTGQYPRGSDEPAAYTAWCGDALFADDATALTVGRQCELECIHSATDGLCTVIVGDEREV